MDNTRDELDRVIDGALASYGDAEPLAGLEERVLNRVRVEDSLRRRMFAWGLAFAVMASVAIVVLVRTERRTSAKPAEVARVTRTEEPTPAIQSVARVRPAKRAKRPRTLPKLEQFPVPTPLSWEERALVTFVQRDPREAQEIFNDLQQRTYEPVEIQPIQIAPLPSDGGQ